MNNVATNDNELSLRELTDFLWHRRWIAVFITAICTLAAGAAAWLLPDKYEARVLLSIVSSQSNAGGLGAASSALSQLGGLASLAGLSVSGGGPKSEALATLQSEALTQRYIQERNLLPLLFNDKWDAQQGQWKASSQTKVPTLWEGNEYFARKVREVTENAKTGLVTLTVTWTDPKLASDWANDLVALTNRYLRDKAIRETEQNISYLNDQAAKTNVVRLQEVIYSLMESEIKEQMLARGRDEYALKVIDPAVPPEKPSFPKPLLWTVGGFLGGALLAVMSVLLWAGLQRPSRS